MSESPHINLANPPRLRPRRKRHIAVIGVLLLIILVLLWLWRLISGPAEGQIRQVSPAPTRAATCTTNKTYNGKYLSFQYPCSYEPAIPPVNAPPVYETATIVGSGPSAKQLALLVYRRLDFTNDANITRRRDGSYLQTPWANGSDRGWIFTKSNNAAFEKTIILQHADLSVSLSLTDPNGSNLSTVFDQILATVSWH